METTVKAPKTGKKTTSKKITENVVNKESTYKLHVLSVNRKLKTEVKSLGGARAILLSFAKEISLPAKWVKILNASKNKDFYPLFAEKVRTSKAGNYSPFFILQSLNKHESYFCEVMKVK